MNVLQRFTLKNLLKNRMRTLVTVVGVILSVAMITAVTTIVSSTRQFTLDLTVERIGSWHGKIAGLSAENYDLLKQSEEIDQIVALQELGYAEIGQATNNYRPYVLIGAADSTLWQMFSLHLTAGRLPQNDRELLLPEGYQTSGAEPAALGDVLTLTLGDRLSTLEGETGRVLGREEVYSRESEEFRPREERTYTVTGFFEDFAGDGRFTAGYTAFTVPTAETAAVQTAYFTMHDMGKTEKFIWNFCDRQDCWNGYDINSDFLLVNGYASEIGVFAAIGGMVAVIMSIVLISAVALIYNAFAISVSERTKQFGVFSSVGATRTQLRRSVLFEGIALGAVGIPLGVGAGILGIGITFSALGDAFRRIININSHVTLSVHVSWLSVGISALLGLITILISAYIPAHRAARRPAIEAIRQSADIKLKAKTVKTSRLTQRLFGFEGALASKNFKRSRKKYRAVVFSLFISIVLFISTGEFCHYVLSSVDSTFGGVGYDLRVDIPESLRGEREEQLLSQLRAQPEITAAQYIAAGYLTAGVPPASLTEDGEEDGQFIHTLFAAGEKLGIDFSKPVKELSPREFDIAMFGAGDEIFDINWEYKRGNVEGTHSFKGKWIGFANLITDEYYRSSGNKNEEELFSLMGETVCPECQGKRLKKELLAVKFAGITIDEFCEKPVTEIKKFLDSFETQDEREREIFLRVKAEIYGKINKIILLGLGHLTLARAASTLSTGERARLRLIKSSADDLQNLIYVVDEPSRGLHPRECENMAKLLKETAANGNTVVAVEHVPEIIKYADHIIEMGPGSGSNGGKIVFEGDYDSLIKSDCYTAKALNFRPVLKENKFSDFITLSNISENNLKNITVSIPLGKTTVISGVSGSGKTTLIKYLSENISGHPVFFDRCGLDNTSVGTSNIASFSGCYDKIKKKFGKSFKITKNDICKTCKGTGKNSVSMDFLGNVEHFCADCNGTGFAENILTFKYKEKNIAEILDMEIGTAAEFFSDDPAIFKVLDTFVKCGLHFTKLSQQVSTLSNGELMRLNFAVSFASFNAEKSRNGIFIFDEPSSGLHFCDVEKLLEMFKTLNDSGNTVIIAEHRSQIIASADYVIDLGPGSGENGGNVVFQGEVRDLVNCAESVTGRMIKNL